MPKIDFATVIELLRKKTTWLWLGIVACVAGFAFWYFQTDEVPSAFETGSVDRGKIVAKVTATGTVAALVSVQVGSQVSGRIAELLVDFNATVKKDDVLARIDAQTFVAAAEQARASLMMAEANVQKAEIEAEQAKRQFERMQNLSSRDLIASADLDTARSNSRAADAEVLARRGAMAQAQAQLRQAEVNLAYTTIVSPINGVVVSRNVEVGQTVAASLQAPTLFLLAEDLRKMQVHTSVAEADIGKLSEGMPAEFSVDAYPGERFRGSVLQIRHAPQTVQNVVTYNAVISVENPELKLRPGMTANVSFIYAQRDDVLRIPNAALRFRPAPELTANLPKAEVKPGERALWYLTPTGEPARVFARIGVTDGTTSELVGESLALGVKVITGSASPMSTGGAPPASTALRRGL